MYPRAGAGRCGYVGHGWESDVGTIKQVVGHGAGDDGEARDELAQPPLPAARPPPALLRRCLRCERPHRTRSMATRRWRMAPVLSVQLLQWGLVMRCGVKSLGFGNVAVVL